MGKRLTEEELRNREIKKVFKKIQKLEKIHESSIIETACYRYKMAKLERRKAEKLYEKAEKELEQAKKRLQ